MKKITYWILTILINLGLVTHARQSLAAPPMPSLMRFNYTGGGTFAMLARDVVGGFKKINGDFYSDEIKINVGKSFSGDFNRDKELLSKFSLRSSREIILSKVKGMAGILTGMIEWNKIKIPFHGNYAKKSQGLNLVVNINSQSFGFGELTLSHRRLEPHIEVLLNIPQLLSENAP